MIIKVFALSSLIMVSSLVIYDIEEYGNATKEDVKKINLDVFHRTQKDFDTFADILGIERFDLQIDKLEELKEAESIDEIISITEDIQKDFGISEIKEEDLVSK